MNAHNEQQWPEYLMLRDTGLSDDAGGLGQQIFTTAGAGHVKQKYVRADLAAQPSPVVKQNLTTQPAAAQEAVAWMTHHDEPMLFPTRAEAITHCADDEEPIPLYAAPVTAAPADLIERCREILAWQRTGVLPGDALRAYANARWPDEHDPLQIAEKETAREAFRILARAAAASTPAASGIDLYPIRYALQYAAAAARENTHTELAKDFDELIRKIDASPKGALNEQFGSAEGLDSPKCGSDAVSDAMIHAALRVQYARAGSLWTGSEANPDFTDMRHILSAAMQAQAGDAEVQP